MSWLQSSGQITLNQIRSVFSGPTNLNGYRGVWYSVNGADNAGTFPSTNITIKTFYGKGPNGQNPAPIDPPPGPVK